MEQKVNECKSTNLGFLFSVKNDVLVPKGIWKELIQQVKILVTRAEAQENSTSSYWTTNPHRKVKYLNPSTDIPPTHLSSPIRKQAGPQNRVARSTVTKRNNKNNTKLSFISQCSFFFFIL
ncbi:hypothetical protein DV515_00000383, partial [Chloebia gouldiae]